MRTPKTTRAKSTSKRRGRAQGETPLPENLNDLQVGHVIYWSRRPYVVVRTGIPGYYGNLIEIVQIDSRGKRVGPTITTDPGLDHRITRTPDEPYPPSLSEIMAKYHRPARR